MIKIDLLLECELDIRRGKVSRQEYIERLLKQSFEEDGILYKNEDNEITSCRRCKYYYCGCRHECMRLL